MFLSFSLDVSIGVGNEIIVFSTLFGTSEPELVGNEKDDIPRKDLREERLEFELRNRLELGDIDIIDLRISENGFLFPVEADCWEDTEEKDCFERCVDSCAVLVLA